VVAEYFFAVRRSDQEHLDERATALDDNAAALDYACHMARELQANGGYDDPRLVVTVRNEMRQTVRYPFFLPAPELSSFPFP
jgi:hypothetical protein